MSPERAAAVAKTERELADRFEHYGLDEPQEKATALVRWLQGQGWRVHPELSDRPAEPRRAPAAVRRQAVADAKAAIEAVKGNRPELEVDR